MPKFWSYRWFETYLSTLFGLGPRSPTRTWQKNGDAIEQERLLTPSRTTFQMRKVRKKRGWAPSRQWAMMSGTESCDEWWCSISTLLPIYVTQQSRKNRNVEYFGRSSSLSHWVLFHPVPSKYPNPSMSHWVGNRARTRHISVHLNRFDMIQWWSLIASVLTISRLSNIDRTLAMVAVVSRSKHNLTCNKETRQGKVDRLHIGIHRTIGHNSRITGFEWGWSWKLSHLSGSDIHFSFLLWLLSGPRD